MHRDQLAGLARIAGVDDIFSLNGHPIVCDPGLLDDALARISAGPFSAAA